VNRVHSKGFALLLVLWAVALLSVIGASFAFGSRTEVVMAGNLRQHAKAQTTADAGARIGILQLVLQSGYKHTLEQPWRVDGTAYEVEFGEATVSVSLSAESGKVDLNEASAELIAAVAEKVTGSPREDLLEALVRSSQEVPRRKHFSSVLQLDGLLRARSEHGYRLGEVFTIYSGASKIDPLVASRNVLLAIPGLTESMVHEFIQNRTMSIADSSMTPSHLLTAASAHITLGSRSTFFSGRVYTVESRVSLRDGGQAKRQAVVQLTDDTLSPYEILAWRTVGDAAPTPGGHGTGTVWP
jgi:general secretion pathway protein K